MNTGCPDCDRNFIDNSDYCPKHRLEHLKWEHETALSAYEDEILKQQETERNQK